MNEVFNAEVPKTTEESHPDQNKKAFLTTDYTEHTDADGLVLRFSAVKGLMIELLRPRHFHYGETEKKDTFKQSDVHSSNRYESFSGDAASFVA
jgi:hypothetical protein